MIDWVACTPQMASDPWPCWKMKTMIPKAAPRESTFRITAFSGSTSERNARASRMKVRITTKASTSGKFE